MKKLSVLLVSLVLLSSTNAFAHPYNMGYGGYHGGGYNWVVPMAIGGVIGYQLNRQPTVVYQAAPQVVYTQPQVIYQQLPQIYVYPVGTPLPAGMQCELRTEYSNGAPVSNNYCHY